MNSFDNISSCVEPKNSSFQLFISSIRNTIGLRKVLSDNLQKYTLYCDNQKAISELNCCISDNKMIIDNLRTESASLENNVVEISSRLMELKTRLSSVNDEIESLESQNLSSNTKAMLARGIIEDCETSYNSYKKSLLQIENFKKIHDCEWESCVNNIIDDSPSCIRQLLFDEFLDSSESSVLYKLLRSMFSQIESSVKTSNVSSSIPSSLCNSNFMTIPSYFANQLETSSSGCLDLSSMESTIPSLVLNSKGSDEFDLHSRNLRATPRVDYSEPLDLDESNFGPMKSKVKPFSRSKSLKSVPKQNLPSTSSGDPFLDGNESKLP